MSDQLTEAEIAEMRTDAEEQLLSTGRILRYSKASDGAGGWKESYAPGPEINCAIAPIGRATNAGGAGNRISEATTHVVTWPAATEVSAKDRCEVDGVTYSITALREFGALNVTRRTEVKAL